jgi:hypothetical protein
MGQTQDYQDLYTASQEKAMSYAGSVDQGEIEPETMISGQPDTGRSSAMGRARSVKSTSSIKSGGEEGDAPVMEVSVTVVSDAESRKDSSATSAAGGDSVAAAAAAAAAVPEISPEAAKAPSPTPSFAASSSVGQAPESAQAEIPDTTQKMEEEEFSALASDAKSVKSDSSSKPGSPVADTTMQDTTLEVESQSGVGVAVSELDAESSREPPSLPPRPPSIVESEHAPKDSVSVKTEEDPGQCILCIPFLCIIMIRHKATLLSPLKYRDILLIHFYCNGLRFRQLFDLI